MTGVQTYHPEWEASLDTLTEMDAEDDKCCSTTDYFSPGLFIENIGLGASLLIEEHS